MIFHSEIFNTISYQQKITYTLYLTNPVIIFKSSGASHVGIVSYYQNGRIYYIDGNNTTYGKAEKATVHSSNCSVSDSRLTCVLHPNY
ncbi:MAG: hypothetical protein II453_03265 [Alphaproteobacteria bacterium]|nr:hypothetical protein [Alphaproteobacteria bacterium]